MTETTEQHTTGEQPVTSERTVPVSHEVREVHVEHSGESDTPSRVGPFIAGFVTAALIAAASVLGYLAVSSDDDDGNIELDVPAVEVDVGG